MTAKTTTKEPAVAPKKVITRTKPAATKKTAVLAKKSTSKSAASSKASTWGGPGRGGGRRVFDAQGKRISIHSYAITITPEDREKLAGFGEGSLSAGIRNMVDAAKQLKKLPPPDKSATPKGLNRACVKYAASLDIHAHDWIKKFGAGGVSAGVRRLAGIVDLVESQKTA